MTRHIIRFINEADRAESYNQLFGRHGVLEKLKNVTNDEKADVAVREYCRSLTILCGYKYVSSAVILEPDQESVRYFLVYATNDAHGIEVFKLAETATAHTQDLIRHDARVQKTRQDELLFDNAPPKTKKILELRSKYSERARKKVYDLILQNKDPLGISYEKLFCEAMAFPLITPKDLESWVASLTPYAELLLEGSNKRISPSPKKDDRLVVIDQVELERCIGLLIKRSYNS